MTIVPPSSLHRIGSRVAIGVPSGPTVTISADPTAVTKARISAGSSIALKCGTYTRSA
jgi:hypothetical protein